MQAVRAANPPQTLKGAWHRPGVGETELREPAGDEVTLELPISIHGGG
jgi:hypothetical protein